MPQPRHGEPERPHRHGRLRVRTAHWLELRVYGKATFSLFIALELLATDAHWRVTQRSRVREGSMQNPGVNKARQVKDSNQNGKIALTSCTSIQNAPQTPVPLLSTNLPKIMQTAVEHSLKHWTTECKRRGGNHVRNSMHTGSCNDTGSALLKQYIFLFLLVQQNHPPAGWCLRPRGCCRS